VSRTIKTIFGFCAFDGGNDFGNDAIDRVEAARSGLDDAAGDSGAGPGELAA
jgi:hypothetical protein